MERYAIIHGDCLEVMRGMDAASVDAIVTDPPYGLSFMGKDWDHGVPGVHFWEAALAVAKPGTHLLAFGGTRTFHRLACAIEDAGWEIRDTIMWVYGSGFPKSLDVSKAIDKAAGAEREVVGTKENSFGRKPGGGDGWDEAIEGGIASDHTFNITAPATDLARKWSGWGTALKPAWEPIIVARKPLIGTVAANHAAHGVGGLNIERCRITGPKPATTRGAGGQHGRYGNLCAQGRIEDDGLGRWPANLIHDGSEEVVGPMGSAARFFYCAKASKADRDQGNAHPTVKPTALMRYLCRLATPPGGVVLDPFAGSGSTGKAAMLEGFNFVGIELNAEYVDIARARIANAAVVV